MNPFVTISPAGSYQGVLNYKNINIKLIGNAEYAPTGGGGWQTVDRPKAVAATQWFDRSPFQLTMTGILDGETRTAPQTGVALVVGYEYDYQYVDDNTNPWTATPVGEAYSGTSTIVSVEDSCKQIESWLDAVPGFKQPPVLTVSGPVPGTAKYWILYSVDFSDAIRDFNTGARTQQVVKITLYEYTPPLGTGYTMFGLTPASGFIVNTGGSTTAATTTYTIKKGDDLWKIANKFRKTMSAADFVAKIKALNGIRDSSHLALGRKIKIPVG